MGESATHGWESPWPFVIALLIGIALMSRGAVLRRTARAIPGSDDGSVMRARRRGFRLVLLAEVVLIAAAVVIPGVAGHPGLRVPLIAVVVGVHFVPLAMLFEAKSYYVVGALLCAVEVVTLTLFPETVTRGSTTVELWWVITGFGAALILWGTALFAWIRGRSLLTQLSLPQPERVGARLQTASSATAEGSSNLSDR